MAANKARVEEAERGNNSRAKSKEKRKSKEGGEEDDAEEACRLFEEVVEGREEVVFERVLGETVPDQNIIPVRQPIIPHNQAPHLPPSAFRPSRARHSGAI